MKIKLLYISISLFLALSCSKNVRNDEIKSANQEISLQTIAVFKSAEQVDQHEWKLIFRKLDDCQYIMFYADIRKLNDYCDILVKSSINTYSLNPDFINLRFDIKYTEESFINQATGDKILLNRMKDISRAKSDRFLGAGFDNDVQADNFIMNLKKYIQSDSIHEISEMISYPVITVIRKKKLKISEPGEFVKDYNIIFNDRVKKTILDQPLSDIKANSKGLIIGSGEICINRIDNRILITSINVY